MNNSNHEQVFSLCKIYAPYFQNPNVKYNKYSPERKMIILNNIHGIEKYYDNINRYNKSKKYSQHILKARIASQRKLSPIRRS